MLATIQSRITIQSEFLCLGLATGLKEPGPINLEEVKPAKPPGTGLALGYRGFCSE